MQVSLYTDKWDTYWVSSVHNEFTRPICGIKKAHIKVYYSKSKLISQILTQIITPNLEEFKLEGLLLRERYVDGLLSLPNLETINIKTVKVHDTERIINSPIKYITIRNAIPPQLAAQYGQKHCQNSVVHLTPDLFQYLTAPGKSVICSLSTLCQLINAKFKPIWPNIIRIKITNQICYANQVNMLIKYCAYMPNLVIIALKCESSVSIHKINQFVEKRKYIYRKEIIKKLTILRKLFNKLVVFKIINFMSLFPVILVNNSLYINYNIIT